MSKISIVFPHQLFLDNPCLHKDRVVHLVEDELYFNQYIFHKQKIVLHRASMKCYEHALRDKGYRTFYQDANASTSLIDLLSTLITGDGLAIHYVDTTDYLLERRLKRLSDSMGVILHKYETPNFLTSVDDFKMSLGKSKKYFMGSFYIHQRKKLDILIEPNGEPTGGKWSFDTENRKRLPKNSVLPKIYQPVENAFVIEAKQYVAEKYSHVYGSDESFSYPVTHEQASLALDDFITNRLRLFGHYEDAIASRESILFHAVLTPALNIGLLTPRQILDRIFELHREQHFPLNSLEGFVRQLIGWREFMRGVYELEGVYERITNSQNFSRKIPATFWKGETGIEPIDFTVKKILKNAYCHHIERLMILGNFMQLCEFDPNEVYRWFMELFIDAYDWVMVPNVYGMSQYADGGLITTKPYVSSSNYLLKMSDYKKGNWCAIWDALYWRYIYKNQEHFKSNPRMSMMVNLLEKMESQKLKSHLTIAENYLHKIEREV